MGIDAEMIVRHRGEPLSDVEVRRIAGDLYAAFGDALWLIYPGRWRDAESRHCLSPVESHEQDGPPVIPEAGEQMLRVSLSGRWYGVGYERGDLPTHAAIAQWLEARIPGCAVWYGGDSSGACAKPFGPDERDALLRHFYEHGRAYYEPRPGETTPRCEFCGGRPMWRQMGHGSTNGYHCHGCNLRLVVLGDGRSAMGYFEHERGDSWRALTEMAGHPTPTPPAAPEASGE